MLFEKLFSSWTLKEITETEFFEQLFSPEALFITFTDSFATSSGKGVDRLNGFQFTLRASAELSVASRKCIAGTYRFAPYLEVLKTKGRAKVPRVIGIPTVRDRVVLAHLNRFLAAMYPECVPRNVAAAYVRQISKGLSLRTIDDTWVCTTDIQTFYDSIERQRLMSLLCKRIHCQPAISLIGHALSAPTVPKNTRRQRHGDFRVRSGVPQGLAISNILASIYMQPIDDAMAGYNVTYFRYVDDVLMYGTYEDVHVAFKSLGGRLKRRGLGLHALTSKKSQIERLVKPFGYLGYVFEGMKITVRDSTVEGFIQSIAAKFSDFKHNKARRLDKFKYLDEQRLVEIFLMELNERITGAIKSKKRYGWIAYFSQITDLSLLHQLDHSIRGLFSRLDEFSNRAPDGLRSLRRAYWEMKFNPNGGYVRDYDKIVTRVQKLELLVERGRVGPDETLTDEQIEARYDTYVRRSLATMLADEGAVYG